MTASYVPPGYSLIDIRVAIEVAQDCWLISMRSNSSDNAGEFAEHDKQFFPRDKINPGVRRGASPSPNAASIREHLPGYFAK